MRLLLVLAVATSLAPLSLDLFAPSLPQATRDLGVSSDQLRLTFYMFLVGYGTAPFFWGKLGDVLGRRLIMRTGLSLYVASTLGCYFASDIHMLTGLRLLQGFGAASGVVMARAVLRDIHGPGGATRAISSMYLIMVWIPISAPLLGGLLSDHFNWRISFVVMALLAGMTLVGSLLWQPESLSRESASQSRESPWYEPLIHPVFLRYTFTNMFCVTTMVIFQSNYSYLAEQNFGLSITQNGYVLALFNCGVAAGVYLVRLSAPVMGADRSIYMGTWFAMSGWLAVLLSGALGVASPVLIMVSIMLACVGTGIIISLTIGKALVPFGHAAGSASALFVCIQSASASAIGYLTSSSIEPTVLSTAGWIFLCMVAAAVSMKVFHVAETAT